MKEPVVLIGKVVRGKALGRTVGMPTANLCITEGIMPEEGVYATRIRIGDGVYTSVTNIGRRPTVDDESYITVETFIIDFNFNYDENDIVKIIKKMENTLYYDNELALYIMGITDLGTSRTLVPTNMKVEEVE